MTEKQIERVRTKIAAVKRALADDKKHWGGYYHDGAGYRYEAPGLFVKIRDFKGAMNYFRWFSKQFPGDVCYGEFLLEWALTLFMMGKLKEAEQKVMEAFVSDTRLWNRFFGRKLTQVDESIEDYERDWAAEQVLGYASEENDWADFAVWVEAVITSASFLLFSETYLALQQRIKSEPDWDKRTELCNQRDELLTQYGLQ